MWKDIIRYENIYQINEFGDIINVKTGNLIKPYISNKGYKLIDLSKNGQRAKYSVHRLVAMHFVPNPDNLPIVLHKDNVKLNTHYTNLKWGTYSENNSQCIRDGLNKVPRPDNCKCYEIYNDTEVIRCYGAKEVINTIGYGNDSLVRNLLFRQTSIPQGQYSGYKIRKVDIFRPIIFDR